MTVTVSKLKSAIDELASELFEEINQGDGSLGSAWNALTSVSASPTALTRLAEKLSVRPIPADRHGLEPETEGRFDIRANDANLDACPICGGENGNHHLGCP